MPKQVLNSNKKTFKISKYNFFYPKTVEKGPLGLRNFDLINTFCVEYESKITS